MTAMAVSGDVVASALRELPRYAWTVVRHPHADGDSVVRDVVVGPRGVFVVSSRPGQLDQLVAATQAVAERVAPALPHELVYAVHCAPGQSQSRSTEGVLRCSPDTLVDTLVRRRGVITPDQVIQALLRVDGEVVASLGSGSPVGERALPGAASAAPVSAPVRSSGLRLRELTGLLALALVIAFLTVFALLQR